MKRLVVAGGLMLGLVLLGGDASAQMGTARGKVVDDKGQPMEGVKISIEYQGGINRKNETKTNKKGEYTQVGLNPGNYKITAEKEGFQTQFVGYKIALGEATVIPEMKLVPGKTGGNSAAAAAAADKAIAEVRAQVDAAIALVNQGKHSEAEVIYADLAAKNPTIPQLFYNLAVVQMQQKKAAESEASFLKALEVKPDYVDAQSALVNMYLGTGQGAKAIEFTQKAAAANPQDAKAQYQAGYALFNSGKQDEAAELFKKAEALDPANAEIHFYLGSIAVAKNDIAECAARMDKYLAAAPAGPNAATATALLAACKPKK
ncbi:MAG: tetratricopeptide repeat protein [Vicinamibacteria bacterium]